MKPLVFVLVHISHFLCLLLRVFGQETQMMLPENVTCLLEICPNPGSENGVPSLTPLCRAALLACSGTNLHLVAFSDNRPVSNQSVAGLQGPHLCVDTLGRSRQAG